MKKLFASLFAFAFFLSLSSPAHALSSFFNGFETDTNGWLTDGTNINRVPSGTNGVNSSTGSFHAEALAGSFTRWGEYESTFPVGGYVTKLDVYLDMGQNTVVSTDKRFDYSSAINNPAGTHRRDFIFSVGTDPTTVGRFAMSASNNSPGWPANPGRDPLFVSESGWYTFRHSFTNQSGVLAVVMDVLDHDGNVLKTWTLSDPTDLIGSTVGGNRYGWIVANNFGALSIDNSSKKNAVIRAASITSPTTGETLSGSVNFTATLTDDDADNIQWAVRQGTCAANTNTIFGNVDGHSDVASINQSDLENQTFSFSGDMSAMTPGMYCFIYNPSEDSGETNLRETVEFNLVTPPVVVPTNKDQCKKDGWKTYTSPSFKNQGSCVSYVVSNDKAGKRD